MIQSFRCLILPALLFFSIQVKAQQISSEKIPVDTLSGYSGNDTDLSFSKENIKLISSVKIDLSKVKFTNELSVLEFLQGRVSGLDISMVSNNPGEGVQALLRGQSFNSNHIPLIVIDGIPQQMPDNAYNPVSNNSERLQGLIPVPLADIQTIEILKDGTSLALYGAEGANGVILIETKKGSKQKLSLTYEFNQSFVKAPSYMPMLNGEEYVLYQLEAWHNAKGAFDIPDEIAMDMSNPNYYNYSANTNWMEEVTQPASAANHHINFSGGNEKNRIYGSVNYLDENGTTINTGYHQLLNRLNFEHYFTKKLTMAINLSYGYSKDDGNSINILGMAFQKAPNMSIWEYDETGKLTGNYFTPYNDYQGSINPVAVSEQGDASNTNKDLMSTAHLQYKFNNWLQIRETFTYSNLSKTAKTNLDYSSLGLDTLLGNHNINNISDRKYEQFRNVLQATVKIPFKDDKINSLNGTFAWIWQNDNYSKEAKGLTDNQVNKLVELSSDKKINAAVTSLHYKFYDRYLLMANTRFESNALADGSAPWDKFYGASLGWRFSEEPFFKFLKLDNGLIHAGLSKSEYHPDGVFSSFSYSSINASPLRPWDNINDFLISGPSGEEIHTPTYDAGLEFGLFGNRLQISADYYNKKPEIQNYPMGLTSKLELKNTGWEGAIDYTVIRRQNFSWLVQFNVAHNELTFTKANYTMNTEPGYRMLGVYPSNVTEGKPFGAIFGYRREGIYSSDEDAYARGRDGNVYYIDGKPLRMMYREYYTFRGGDTKYKDQNYDGRIDDADIVYLGNSNPTYTGGFGSTVRFKNLTLTCNFHYRMGNKVINQTAMYAEGILSKNNMSNVMLNRWRVQGQQEPDLMPRAYFDHPANYLPSDRYVESGSFVRMNYLNLGYDFGTAICQKIHVKDLSLSLSGQRLYTYSTYGGLNPETVKSTTGLNTDNSMISSPKVYTISMRITI